MFLWLTCSSFSSSTSIRSQILPIRKFISYEILLLHNDSTSAIPIVSLLLISVGVWPSIHFLQMLCICSWYLKSPQICRYNSAITDNSSVSVYIFSVSSFWTIHSSIREDKPIPDIALEYLLNFSTEYCWIFSSIFWKTLISNSFSFSVAIAYANVFVQISTALFLLSLTNVSAEHTKHK